VLGLAVAAADLIWRDPTCLTQGVNSYRAGRV